MTALASHRATETGIAKWKAQAARRAAVDDVARQIDRIERIAAKEGISARASTLLESAAKRLSKPTHGILYTTVERRICKAMKVTPDEINGRSRSRNRVSLARQAIMYWAARLTRMSPQKIGERMGGRDHSTVYFGVDAYPKKRKAQGRHLRPIERVGQFKGKR